ncbi:Transcription factor tau subunit sfc4 [Fulvia fulva]|uniref:Transcription factor tau subunit sfc4 n=1 Tax=Passalora fulva TaxID=5499 RepID=A0A9Q8UVP7_PASFU|nr:Transcription factor tau subunit sfc4 [Fulvia fulva]KAK4611688.1 Transcription factor tau subunit sfc4 [Fulvia fulva]KAK4612815.1 Transcription factor tau subunit sfc4 [Fulvia fulva]UJO24130.1 Transcription factor tau subunit sfc4 [Fulvia fulva]WPV20897.1 Transcription factor tau subunit sfc4 [Fulvia fulva]WPV36332.1 Transcription factor tau subunit sfc4 [Fulvia fulva]
MEGATDQNTHKEDPPPGSAGNHHVASSAAETSYPDPSRNPQFGAYGPFAGSSNLDGSFGAPHHGAGSPSWATPPGAQAVPQSPFTAQSSNNWMSMPQAGFSLPDHPLFAPPMPQDAPAVNDRGLTQAQVVAQQFHMRHGDPGSRLRGGDSTSYLAGQWGEDTGGRAAAGAAYRAAVNYGGTHEWDPDFDPYMEDAAGLGELLDETDMITPNATRGDHSGRTRSGVGRGRGRGGWRKLLKGTEHADLFEKPRTINRGRGRGRPRGRGRKAADPGPEFRQFMKKAQDRFLDEKYEEALDNVRQAIHKNPEMYTAHVLLVQILDAMGRAEDAATAMEHGAATARDPRVYVQAADKILQLAGDDERSPQLLKRAIQCYSDALKLSSRFKDDKDLELELRGAKFELEKEAGKSREARLDARNIVKAWPYQTYYIGQWAQLCGSWHDTSEMKDAKEAYETAFREYEDEDSFGHQDDETDQWSHLNLYLDLCDMVGTHEPGLFRGKQLARWFLGRQDETFWDRIKDDDREYDDDNGRRVYLPEWQQGRASRDMEAYGQGLPVDIRVKFGMLRLKSGVQHYPEAMRHFQTLHRYDDQVEDYYDIFLQVGRSLQEANYRSEAIKFYDLVRKVPIVEDRDEGIEDKVWMQIANCYNQALRHGDAIACYEIVHRHKRASQDYTVCCARLCKHYEDIGEIDKARQLCNELILYNRLDLLHTAGVKMAPPMSNVLRPHKYDLAAPRVPLRPLKPPVVYRELRPAGDQAQVPANQGTFAEMRFDPAIGTPTAPAASTGPVNLGPVSQEVELPPAPPEHVPGLIPQKRKRGRKNALLPPAEDDDEDGGEGSAPKRPRLQKTWNKAHDAKRQARFDMILDAQERCLASFDVVKQHWRAMKTGEDEDVVEQWVEAANVMLKDFTDMKVFFPERDKTLRLELTDDPSRPFKKQNQRHEDIVGPNTYLQIPFHDWHRVFSDLALIYAGSGEQDRCYYVVKDVLMAANVFFLEKKLKWANLGVAFHCALAFNDSFYAIELVRELIRENEFRGGTLFQLFAAVNRFSYGSNWFNSGPSQKFMLRMVKQFDFLAMEPEVRDRIEWSIQKASLEERVRKMDGERHELDAGVLMMYGHMVAVANHSHTSIPYYLRALALEPENVCVNLSLATMWVQISMKRQTDNRQFGINQGLAFLYRYYHIRAASGKASHLQEAEYNVARMWHYLGLTHLAQENYQKVLALSEQVQAEGEERKVAGEMPVEDEVEDLATEAAYAMQQIMLLAGNVQGAMALTEKWLVF